LGLLVDEGGEEVVALKIGALGFFDRHPLSLVELVPAVGGRLQAVIVVVGDMRRIVLGLDEDVLFYQD